MGENHKMDGQRADEGIVLRGASPAAGGVEWVSERPRARPIEEPEHTAGVRLLWLPKAASPGNRRGDWPNFITGASLARAAWSTRF